MPKTAAISATIEIRALQPDNGFDDLIALSREFFGEYESHHPDFFMIDKLSDDDIVAYFSRWLDNEDERAFVALTEGRIVGYITVYVYRRPGYWQIKEVGEISGLMVHKAYRRQGIARHLLTQARAFLGERGVRYFTVYTSVENRGGLAFYGRSGLQPLYTTMLGNVPDVPDGGTLR
jgi:ribosomal protein S18 acetylase RimI-like enzyme